MKTRTWAGVTMACLAVVTIAVAAAQSAQSAQSAQLRNIAVLPENAKAPFRVEVRADKSIATAGIR